MVYWLKMYCQGTVRDTPHETLILDQAQVVQILTSGGACPTVPSVY